MSIQKILNENWSDYDDRKMKSGSDSQNFAVTEEWEISYLVNKLVRYYPFIQQATIRTAIQLCASSTPPPHPRNEFIECVANRLGLA